MFSVRDGSNEESSHKLDFLDTETTRHYQQSREQDQHYYQRLNLAPDFSKVVARQGVNKHEGANQHNMDDGKIDPFPPDI